MTRLFATILVAALLAATNLVSAGAQTSIGDDKLAAFVVAASKVEAVFQRWDPQIKAAEDSEKKTDMVNAAKSEMKAAVEETPDLTVDEYNEIVQTARDDPELAARIETMFGEQGGKQ